jgi:hypothetical protein
MFAFIQILSYLVDNVIVHVDDRCFFFLFAYSLRICTLILPRCWTGASNKCTGRMIFLTAHIEKKLYWVTEVGRENATKMNARYSLKPDEWVKQFCSDRPYSTSHTRTNTIIMFNATNEIWFSFIIIFFFFKLHTFTYSKVKLVKKKNDNDKNKLKRMQKKRMGIKVYCMQYNRKQIRNR